MEVATLVARDPMPWGNLGWSVAMVGTIGLERRGKNMSMYVNGNLAIESFLLQEWKDGTWKNPTWLSADHKYRFAVKVRNNAVAAGALDLSQTLFSMLIPGVAHILPRGKVIVFGRVKVSISGQPTALNAYQFYGNSNYSGVCTPAASAEAPEPLRNGEYATLFVHFIWKAGPVKVSPLPATYVPRVAINARELKLNELPDGPLANLQPNT